MAAPRRVTYSFALAAAYTFATGSALAAHRLVVVDPNPSYEHALRVSLEAWSITVVPSREASLGRDVDEATDRALAIARSEHADAVSWTTSEAVYLYELGREQLHVRRASAVGELDDAFAASMALTLKTLLRSSEIAPREERIGAPDAEPKAGIFRLLAGGRARRFSDAGFEPRASLGIAWYPKPFAEHAGVALEAEGGIGPRSVDERLSARLSHVSTSFALRGGGMIGRHLRAEASGGMGLHVVSLDGALVDGGSVHVLRLDPSIDASGSLSVRATPILDIGLRAGGLCALRPQRFLVSGAPALELSRVAFDVGAIVSVRLN